MSTAAAASIATQAPAAERDVLRHLASQVAEVAAEPRMKGIIRRWCDVNALRKPDRAPVWCRPVGCWKELLPPESLICRTPMLRDLEYEYRQILIKRGMDDDSIVWPYQQVQSVFDVTPANCWGVEIKPHKSSSADGAWGYNPPILCEADLEKLRQPKFSYNAAKTKQRMEQVQELVGDILPVKRVAFPGMSPTLGTPAAELRGLQQMMLDMVDQPELLHRLMAFLRDAMLATMDQYEAAGVLTPNTNTPMLCSDHFGPELQNGQASLLNSWAFANSQEFDQVSPAMWEEFCLEYQKPIFKRFGLVCYGCCENLTRKISGVLSVPNMRIFVCSGWSDFNRVLTEVSAQYCIMWRQKASEVILPHDTDAIQAQLQNGAKALQGRPYQIILRELQTLAGHEDRLHVWTRLAKDAAEKYA